MEQENNDLENIENDVDRIYHLIERLREGKADRFVEFSEDRPEWVVKFVGVPSIRHANRIAFFKEFLSAGLRTGVNISGAKPGSVVVEFIPCDTGGEFSQYANALVSDKGKFVVIARKLGISEIEFSNQKITF